VRPTGTSASTAHLAPAPAHAGAAGLPSDTGAELDVGMIPAVLEPFWPSRRIVQFNEWCSPAA